MTGRRRLALARWSFVIVALLTAALAAFPDTRYLLHAAWAEGSILARRRSIPDVIADPRTSEALRGKLGLVQAARRFAADSIGLDVRNNFTMYTRLEHDTLVLVLAGARKDLLAPVTWWFPIVGQMPYKGFFDSARAVSAEQELQRSGYDTYLRPSSAFSTLGWFSDPVVSTTLEGDSAEIVETVIHELTHSTFYPPGQAVFSESFANFVGMHGASRFFLAHGDSAKSRTIEARWADEVVLGRFWEWLWAALDTAFRARPGEDARAKAARLAARDSIYRAARDSLVHSLPRRLTTIPAEALAHTRLDNAVLFARIVYASGLDRFDVVLARSDGNLARAVARVIAIGRGRLDDPLGAVRTAASRPGL